MSQSKFASITSALLARKGEATPWEESRKSPLPWAAGISEPSANPRPFMDPPARSEPAFATQSHQFDEQPREKCPRTVAPNRIKKCAVRLSCHDYERLGILAVKSKTTRHHLMQEALWQFHPQEHTRTTRNAPVSETQGVRRQCQQVDRYRRSLPSLAMCGPFDMHLEFGSGFPPLGNLLVIVRHNR